MAISGVIGPTFKLGAMASALVTIYQMDVAVNEFFEEYIP
jgi:hypothetical protein